MYEIFFLLNAGYDIDVIKFLSLTRKTQKNYVVIQIFYVYQKVCFEIKANFLVLRKNLTKFYIKSVYVK